MKIKTRLLLFLLPTVISCIVLIAGFLSYNWYKEILENFRVRLKATVGSAATLVNLEDPNILSLLLKIKRDINISNLYLIFPNSLTSSSLKLSKKHNPFLTKVDYITRIYTPKGSKNKMMTGIAPIFNKKGEVVALMAADVSLNIIDKKIQNGLLLIIVSAFLTLLLMTVSLFIIADKIAEPVQKLNNSALSIAAGHYGHAIKVKGPKEIVELSNTLNTMSECLQENINRLKENSLVREKMYGKYESALLLQKQMLKKVIEECESDLVAMNSISFFSDNPKGLFLDFPKNKPHEFNINLVEAKNRGFEGMYALLTNYQLFKKGQKINSPSLRMTLNHKTRELSFETNSFNQPLIWSLKNSKITKASSKTSLSPGDFFFIYNHGLSHSFTDLNKLKATLSKVLKFFAEDGMETCSNMLEKELFFATKNKELDEDIHLICFQLLY